MKLWDVRARGLVMSYKKHTDYITCFKHHAKDNCLVVTSGDGTLSVHDLRTRKLKVRAACLQRTRLLDNVCPGGGATCSACCSILVLYCYYHPRGADRTSSMLLVLVL